MSVGECVDLHELPGTPAGTISNLGGVDTYVAKGSRPGSVLLATDGFGLGIVNPKLVADRLQADTGFTVYVPQLFPGGPMKPDDFQMLKKASGGPLDAPALVNNFSKFSAWIARGNNPLAAFKRLEAVKAAACQGKPTAIVGYSGGGKVAVLAAANGLVDRIVLYHPALLEMSDADSISVPTLLQRAELDPIFFADLSQHCEKTLQDKGLLDSRSKVYANTVHGFGCRPDLSDAQVAESFDESIKATVAFLLDGAT